jgi:uncharacterized lipoprotein YmbA
MNVRLLACLYVFMISACARSPGIHYFALSEQPESVQPRAASSIGDSAYAVGAVIVPDLLDRPQIVIRTDTNAVDIRDNDRWASRLTDQLRRVLAADLRHHLGPGAIVEPGLPPPPGCGIITVSILAFDPQEDGGGVIDASWTISKRAAGNQRDAMKTFRARHTMQGSKGDIVYLVATMSALVSQVSDDIAATLVAEN